MSVDPLKLGTLWGCLHLLTEGMQKCQQAEAWDIFIVLLALCTGLLTTSKNISSWQASLRNGCVALLQWKNAKNAKTITHPHVNFVDIVGRSFQSFKTIVRRNNAKLANWHLQKSSIIAPSVESIWQCSREGFFSIRSMLCFEWSLRLVDVNVFEFTDLLQRSFHCSWKTKLRWLARFFCWHCQSGLFSKSRNWTDHAFFATILAQKKMMIGVSLCHCWTCDFGHWYLLRRFLDCVCVFGLLESFGIQMRLNCCVFVQSLESPCGSYALTLHLQPENRECWWRTKLVSLRTSPLKLWERHDLGLIPRWRTAKGIVRA